MEVEIQFVGVQLPSKTNAHIKHAFCVNNQFLIYLKHVLFEYGITTKAIRQFY